MADPTAVIPILVDEYGADDEIDAAYADRGQPGVHRTDGSDYTEANGLLLDRPRPDGRRGLPALETAGETDLPTGVEILDTTFLEEARQLGR